MCKKCEKIKEKHKNYNYCPYCGKKLKESCFIPDFNAPRGNLFIRMENGSIVDRG